MRDDMKNTRQQRFTDNLRGLFFAVVIAAFAAACAPIPIVALNVVAKSALFLFEKDVNRTQFSGPISIEEMLAQAKKSGDT